MPSPAAEAIRHAAFEERTAGSLAEARLTDRNRLALVLQGAAILAHLDRAGWHLPRGWESAQVAADGTLDLEPPAPGLSPLLHQRMLTDLVARLFGGPDVPGRGQARKAARALAKRWRHTLTALPADEAVGDVLELAPFLWQPAFATVRRRLAGEHRRNGSWRMWVAGPPPSRRRLLAAAADRDQLEQLLAGDRARREWEGSGSGAPSRLAAAGRWQEAVAEWAADPPRSAADRLRFANSLYSIGQFEKAHKALYRLRGTPAAILRIRCQYRLGRLRPAATSVHRLAAADRAPPLSAEETLELAEVAVRVFANLGDSSSVRRWVDRARSKVAGAKAPRARLLAALAAWDLGVPGEMSEHLEAARDLAAEREHGWRWHFAASLAATAAGDDGAAQASLERALAERRRLTRFEAGELWNEMGIVRARRDDLAGAERAFRHTVRLLGSCEGPRETTLALYNLAEIRVRRGRLQGVRPVLEEATLENRLADNLRGSVQDAELWARFELAQGRPRAALAHCREALDRLARRRYDWRRDELEVLAARALGWLGRQDEAAAALGDLDAGASELEAEEIPALWAHAGRRERALAAAAETGFAPLWQALLAGDEVPAEAWQPLAELEEYRAARLVFDAELIAPGSPPPHWRRRAIAAFRAAGATAFAARLEVHETGPWAALAQYLEAPRETAFAELLTAAGYPRARLVLERDLGDEVLAAGSGGEHRLSAETGGGTLVLTAPEIDAVLAVLFALLARDLDRRGGSESRPRPRGGIVGSSPPLEAALDRLRRLAGGDLPLLIRGESGTGKELAARLVHRLGPRRERPFVALNCAALSETLLLSDLFGHVRGAFTGADRDRAGVFETARGGTVFLDEIGDLPLTAQGMLLRVVQEGEVRRVGESLPRKVKVRVVTATHRDLAAMIEDETFRRDLFFRLKVASIELPPLRHRGEDLFALASHFLSRAAPGRSLRLSSSARSRLLAHPWPGNVRELKNVLEVAAALAGGDVIEPRHLELPEIESAAAGGSYHARVDAYRRRLLSDALTAAEGNRAQAARRLGLSRQALSYLIRQLELL